MLSIRAPRAESLRNVLLVSPELSRHFGCGWSALQGRAHLGLASHRPGPELLDGAGHSDRGGPVPQVALDFTDDVRHREGGELAASFEVKAIDRVDEADAACLEEVVVVLGALVSMRQALDQGEIKLDQPITCGDITVVQIGMKKTGCRRCLLAPVG